MEAGAKIQIAFIKGLFNGRPNDDEFADQQVGQLGPGSDRDTHTHTHREDLFIIWPH